MLTIRPSALFLKFTLIALCFSQNLHAVIPAASLKGINSPLSDPQSAASPLQGILYDQSGFLQNRIELADEKAKTPAYRLIKILFQKSVQGDYIPSQKGSSPASYLTPEITGNLLGYIYSAQYTKKNLNTLRQVWLTGLYNHQDFKTVLANFRLKYEQATEESRNLENQEQTEQVRKNRESLSRSIRKYYVSDKELRRNFNRILAILFEGKSDPELWHIMTALLWHKVRKKEDYLSYYRGLLIHAPEFPVSIPEGENLGQWLKSSFSLDFWSDQNLLKLSREEQFYQLSKGSAPASIKPVDYDDSKFHGFSYTDCGETSLRNFFRALIFNGRMYQTDILRKVAEIHGISSDAITEFFKNYPTDDEQFTNAARNAWSEVVSNLNSEGAGPTVIYRRKRKNTEYEISSRKNPAKNIEHILQHLLGVADFETFAQNLSDITGQEYLFKKDLKSGYGTIEFRGIFGSDYVWTFEDGHFYITLKNKSSRDLSVAFIRNLFRQSPMLFPLLPAGKNKHEVFQKLIEEDPHNIHLAGKNTRPLDQFRVLMNSARTSGGQAEFLKSRLTANLVRSGFLLKQNHFLKDKSPLDHLIKEGRTDLISLLLKHSAPLKPKNGLENNPVCAAILHQKDDILALLLEADTDLSASCGEKPPIIYAASKGHTRAVRLLLDAGADKDAVDGDHATALAWAAYKRHTEVAAALLRSGAAVNTKERNGKTPLHWASQNGNKDLILLLLESGADPETTDRNDQNPLDVAKNYGTQRLIRNFEKGNQVAGNNIRYSGNCCVVL